MNAGRTPDNKHIDLGTGDVIPMPPGFNAPDNAATCPGSWGHIVPDDEDDATVDMIPEY